jgi:hypothetical protein
MSNISALLNGEFIALTLALCALVVVAVHRGSTHAAHRTSNSPHTVTTAVTVAGFGLAFWLAATAAIASTGWLWEATAMPPRIVLLVAPTMVGMIIFARSAKVKTLLDAVSPAWIVGFQAFRIVMELILWQLFRAQIIPVQMTFEGLNADILVGITAVPVAYLLARKRISPTVLVAWNVVSMAVLLNIVVVSTLSSPVPFRTFMNEPANTIILSFPFVWLPTVVVPIAFLGHIASLRQHGYRMNA